MSRIRSLHPGQWKDDDFTELSPWARLLTLGIRNLADDNGVFEWKPKTIKRELFPDDTLDMLALLAELETKNQVRKFESGGASFGAIRNFRKWQRPEKPKVTHPLPDEMCDYVGSRREDDPMTALRKRKWAEQSGLCFYCRTEISHYNKRTNSLEIDHKTPISRGGSDADDNLCAACRPCNRAKHDMTAEEYAHRNRDAKQPDAPANRRDAPQRKEEGGRMEEESEATASESAQAEMRDLSEVDRRPKNQRGARLPADWAPDVDDRAFAESLGLDVDRVAANYRDYWISRPGPAGVKLDWHATWRIWCRKEADSGRSAKTTTATQPESIHDRIAESERRHAAGRV